MSAHIKSNFPKPDDGEYNDLFWKAFWDPVILLSCIISAFPVAFILLHYLGAFDKLPAVWYTLIGTSGAAILGGGFASFCAMLKAGSDYLDNSYED